jgi:hypothetical protein
MPQKLVYPDIYPDLQLQGKPKGMKAMLQECESVWQELSLRCHGKVVAKCKSCQKSQVKKDAERRVAAAEAMGQEDTFSDNDISQAEEVRQHQKVSSAACIMCCHCKRTLPLRS